MIESPEEVKAHVKKVIRDGGDTFETQHRTKDGEIRDVVVSTKAIDLPGRGCFLAIWRDVTERKRAAEALRSVRRKLMNAREAERRRFARELHDSTSQRILALQLRLRTIRGMVPAGGDGRFIETLTEAENQALQLIQGVRRISHGLYPPTLEQLGLKAAIEQIRDDFALQAVRVSVMFDESLDDAGFGQDVDIAVFRIAQEAASNAFRHGQADNVTLTLTHEDGHVVLKVTDDGVGFDPSTTVKGLGLNTMRDRIEALDGALEICSSPGRTVVEARIPARPLRRGE